MIRAALPSDLGIDHRNRLATEMCGDHRAVEKIFRRLEADEVAGQDRRTLVEQAVTLIVTHAVAAEQVVYPAARRALSDGDVVADRQIARNAEAEQTMKDLEQRDADDPEFAVLLQRVIDDARLHAQDEERTLLPRLAIAVGLAGSEAAGKAVAAAKKTAPTRPHPNSPDTTPGNLAAPLVGLVDRVRDAAAGRGR